jgi:nicotinamide-nucleotide adenylyltransferase
MRKYKVALFIGRFQPFHNGHLYSLEKCLEIADKVTIAVGSSQESGTENNPWDYTVRKQMICEVVRERGIEGRVEKIISCPDNPSDSIWLSEIKKRAGTFDVVVSNNTWVLEIMKGAGYAVIESGLFNRDELEGVKIREMMRKGDEGWKLRVPKEVLGQIDVSAI